MPYVAGPSGWGLEQAQLLNNVKAGSLYRPVAGVLPSGIVTVGAFTATAQSFTNAATYLWNSGIFNTQGQRWVGVDGTPSNGCRNEATPRTSGGSRYNHIQSLEFSYNGQALDIDLIAGSYYETLVYLEGSDKRMYRAEVNPKTGTTTGLVHLPLNFAANYNGRIRVVLIGGVFVGVKCEQSAILKKTPERTFAILDGAEWSEGAGIKQASGTSYQALGLSTYLFEKTGFVFGDRAQSDTGFFRNGSATVTDDTASATNQTRWFSQNRKDWVATDFTDKPLFYLIAGSRVDGGNSGATGSSTGPMATRAKVCYDWIRSNDRLCKIVQMSVSPFTGAGAAGTITGPPTAGNGFDLNHQEQASAIATITKAEFVNLFGPTNPPFVGTGSNGSPSSSQQAALIGVDGMNPNDLGFNFWASQIAVALSPMLVNTYRARRLR